METVNQIDNQFSFNAQSAMTVTSGRTRNFTRFVLMLSLAVHAVTFAVEWAFRVSHVTLGSKTSIYRSLCTSSLFHRVKFGSTYLGKHTSRKSSATQKPVYFVCIPLQYKNTLLIHKKETQLSSFDK